MGFTFALIVILGLVVIIWIIGDLKRSKHKVLMIFLILLILFAYISGTIVFSGKTIDYKSFSGVESASSLYFSWLKHSFSNVKVLTGNAIKMDWKNYDNSVKSSANNSQ